MAIDDIINTLNNNYNSVYNYEDLPTTNYTDYEIVKNNQVIVLSFYKINNKIMVDLTIDNVVKFRANYINLYCPIYTTDKICILFVLKDTKKTGLEVNFDNFNTEITMQVYTNEL